MKPISAILLRGRKVIQYRAPNYALHSGNWPEHSYLAPLPLKSRLSHPKG